MVLVNTKYVRRKHHKFNIMIANFTMLLFVIGEREKRKNKITKKSKF